MTDRYHRQMLLPGIGAPGQQRLREARVLLVGCGALGSVIADLLARAGIGTLRIVDRDVVELTNLSRQVLFDERDVEQGLPKAEAAKLKINAINRDVKVEAHVDDFAPSNAERYARGIDLILDGLDNFQTRYLLNDLAVKHSLPYLYGGAVATTGMAMPILPHHDAKRQARSGQVSWPDTQSTPCLRCVFPEAPPPGTTPTCDTAGVLATAVTTIASHQVTTAIKLITGHLDSIDRRMISIDVWANTMQAFDVSGARSDECPCCGLRKFEFLEGSSTGGSTSLCGRNAIQISPPPNAAARLDLPRIAGQLAAHGAFEVTRFLLRGTFASVRGDNGQPVELTLFPDGRAIIKNVTTPDAARSIYDKFVGS